MIDEPPGVCYANGIHDRILSEILSVTGCSQALFGFVENDAKEQVLRAWSRSNLSGGPEPISSMLVPLPQDSLWSQWVNHPEPRILNRFPGGRLAWDGSIRGDGPIENLLLVPLADSDRVLAVAVALNRPGGFQVHHELELQGLLAPLCGLLKRRRTWEDLRWQTLLNKTLDRLVADLNTGQEDMEGLSLHVLRHAQELTGSADGCVGYIDPNDRKLVCFTSPQSAFMACLLAGGSEPPCLSPDENGGYPGPWAQCIKTGECVVCNEPGVTSALDGKAAPLERFLSAPALHAGEVVGQISLGNRKRDYHAHHREALECMARLYALAFCRFQSEQQRQALENQLRQTHQMTALGALASGIVHDFNNLLSTIIGYAELVAVDLGSNHPSQEDLASLSRAAQRASSLSRRILEFSRRHEQSREPIKLAPIMRECLELLRASLPSAVEILDRIQDQDGAVMADSTQMHQLIMNICINAGQAMTPAGGVLTVGLGRLELGPEEADGMMDMSPGPHQVLCFQDTGPGMEPQIMARVFEPFFTTKTSDQGTGMGLAVVHGIVTAHKGGIRVESAPGEGTGFFIYLPEMQVHKSEPERSAPEAPENMPGGPESIMVVDDDKDVAVMNGRLLSHLGYEARVFNSGFEALEHLQGDPEGTDLIIADLDMPRMDGMELARRAMRLRPGLPVILCSGLFDPEDEEKAKSLGIMACLYKPVRSSTLAATLRSILGDFDKR